MVGVHQQRGVLDLRNHFLVDSHHVLRSRAAVPLCGANAEQDLASQGASADHVGHDLLVGDLLSARLAHEHMEAGPPGILHQKLEAPVDLPWLLLA